MTKDCSEMTDGQLLRELVDRFIRYDKARDKFINFLCSELAKSGVNPEGLKRWDRLHMDRSLRSPESTQRGSRGGIAFTWTKTKSSAK